MTSSEGLNLIPDDQRHRQKYYKTIQRCAKKVVQTENRRRASVIREEEGEATPLLGHSISNAAEGFLVSYWDILLVIHSGLHVLEQGGLVPPWLESIRTFKKSVTLTTQYGHSSMTSLLTHNVAHSTGHSFRPKINNQPLKKFLSLAFSWVKVIKN